MLTLLLLLALDPKVVNGSVERRSGFELRAAAPTWFVYTVAAPPDTHESWCSGVTGKVWLEGVPEVAILFRVESNEVTRIAMHPLDCEFDAGGKPVVLLTGVSSQQSVGHLRGFVRTGDRQTEDLARQALRAIAWHREADPALLIDQARPGAPYRLTAVSLLGLMRDPSVTALLKSLARADSQTNVRSTALRALARQPAAGARAVILEAIDRDPDPGVRREAVHALSRFPKSEPELIRLAKTHPLRDVKKEAVRRLGYTRDPQAVAYLEQLAAGR